MTTADTTTYNDNQKKAISLLRLRVLGQPLPDDCYIIAMNFMIQISWIDHTSIDNDGYLVNHWINVDLAADSMNPFEHAEITNTRTR